MNHICTWHHHTLATPGRGFATTGLCEHKNIIDPFHNGERKLKETSILGCTKISTRAWVQVFRIQQTNIHRKIPQLQHPTSLQCKERDGPLLTTSNMYVICGDTEIYEKDMVNISSTMCIWEQPRKTGIEVCKRKTNLRKKPRKNTKNTWSI